MLNSNAHFNTNTNSQNHTVTSEFNYDVELQDQAYGALARASDISVLSDASADAYGMNSSQQQLRGAKHVVRGEARVRFERVPDRPAPLDPRGSRRTGSRSAPEQGRQDPGLHRERPSAR